MSGGIARRRGPGAALHPPGGACTLPPGNEERGKMSMPCHGSHDAHPGIIPRSSFNTNNSMRARMDAYRNSVCMGAPQRHPAGEVQVVQATLAWTGVTRTYPRAGPHADPLHVPCLPGGPPPGTRALGPHVAPHMHPYLLQVPPWRATARDTRPWDPMRYPACIPPFCSLFFSFFSLDGASGEK